MRFPYTYTSRVESGQFAGREVFSIDVQIEAYAEIDERSDEPVVEVEDVFFNIGDWSKPQFIAAFDCGNLFLIALGSEIAKEAAANKDFVETVIDRSDISLSGNGSNDPLGRFIQ